MTLFQHLQNTAGKQPIVIDPIPSDLLTTEERIDLLRTVAKIRERIEAQTDFWKGITDHYGPLE